MKRLLCLAIFILLSNRLYSKQTTIYDFNATTLRGQKIQFSSYKNKVLILTNIASQCGYTSQLKDLQSLHQLYHKKGLIVLGFPSNSFNQEPLEGDKISDFCRFNYGVRFTIFGKISVTGPKINPIFDFLVKRSSSNKEITWNFEKFLLNKKGKLIKRYPSSVNPTSKMVKDDIEKLLNE